MNKMDADTAELLEEQYKEELSAVENEWKPLLEEPQKAFGKKPDNPGVYEARMKLNEMLPTARNGKYGAKCAVNGKDTALIEMEIGNLEGECNEKMQGNNRTYKGTLHCKNTKA